MIANLFLLHYEKDDVTNACLAELVKEGVTPSNVKIIVIDNGSPIPYKLPLPYRNKTFTPRVKVFRLPENLFLIDAFNRAIEKYPSDAYICLTNDTTPTVGLFDRLLDVLSDENVGVVAPGTNDSGSGILYTGEGPIDRDSDTAHVDNTCWAFTQKTVDKIGLPDCEGHTHRACWASNADYCYRAREAGLRIVAVTTAYIRHAHTGGQDMVAYDAGKRWLIEKYGNASMW